MNTPLDNRSPYNILHVAFTSFNPIIALTAIAPYIKYIKIQEENFDLIM